MNKYENQEHKWRQCEPKHENQAHKMPRSWIKHPRLQFQKTCQSRARTHIAHPAGNFTILTYVRNAEERNPASVRQAVRECRVMVVLLNEETFDSEWCKYEWQCAEEFGVPVIVLIDMARASKAVCLERSQPKHAQLPRDLPNRGQTIAQKEV